MTYDDYGPELLARYAWLLDRDGRDLYDDAPPHYCKACGDPVPAGEQKQHHRGHVRELHAYQRKTTAQRRRENTARLRRVNALRRETR